MLSEKVCSVPHGGVSLLEDNTDKEKEGVSWGPFTAGKS